MAETLEVIILTPNKVILRTKALAVSSKSSLGPFDILPRHANLIALIQNTPISILLEDKKKVEYIFPMAIVYNLKNVVKIYTDILAQPDIKIA
jgi:F0F1-type ATP synthase epsilon subunit